MSPLWEPVLKANGCYTGAYVTAVDTFREVLKDTHFPPGNSVLFTSSPVGSVTINVVKDDIISEYAINVYTTKHGWLSSALLRCLYMHFMGNITRTLTIPKLDEKLLMVAATESGMRDTHENDQEEVASVLSALTLATTTYKDYAFCYCLIGLSLGCVEAIGAELGHLIVAANVNSHGDILNLTTVASVGCTILTRGMNS
ncbi:chalcone isomerase [Tanacetum coccineum]